ncbi:MAG: molybdenum cofactor guanylyltransferase [Armatimonadota bacterium]
MVHRSGNSKSDTSSRVAVAGAILAGGEASRFGGVQKGLLQARDGVCILQWQISQMRQAGVKKIIVAANDPTDLKHLGVPVVPDLRPDIGPLAGIEASLAYYDDIAKATLFMPCDLPGLTDHHIRVLKNAYITGEARIVIARTEHHYLHPLCAIVHNELLAHLSRAIDGGTRKVRQVWDEVGAVHVDFDDSPAFCNINSPEDLKRWRQIKEER